MKLNAMPLALFLVMSAFPAWSLEDGLHRLREDFGMEPLAECALNYYIPCPTSSWFSGYCGWEIGDVLGAWFQIGDISMFGYGPRDPTVCHTLIRLRALDFSGFSIP